MNKKRKAFFSEEKKQKTFMSFACVGVLVAFCGAALAVDGPQPALPMQPLTIISKGGTTHKFMVEIASTPLEQEIGEMYRTNIPADRGMFFDWGTPREVPMWMKNCPVPEDMVFIGADGTITHIAENTVPESETNISSGGPVRATLELQGGITAKLDISVGDRISGVIFGKKRST